MQNLGISPFVSRHLNRSISQSSTRTPGSPPTIPPLDLRPTFPSPSLRTSKPYAIQVLPTIDGSPDEDSNSTQSWVTATSDATEQRQTLDRPPSARLSNASLSPAYRSSVAYSASSIIDTRWLNNTNTASDRELFADAHLKPHVGKGTTTRAYVLFWLGFIAPWCWLIGGWLPEFKDRNRNEKERENVGGASVLPTWKMAEKSERRHGTGFGYPFVAPSLESLGGSSTASDAPVLKAKSSQQTDIVDPWVFRCRLASGVAGIALTAAFVVAFIVVGRNQ